jgi:hypothetical protein
MARAETFGEKAEEAKKLFWKKLFLFSAGLAVKYAAAKFLKKMKDRREERANKQAQAA